MVQTLQDRTWFDRLYVDTRKSSSYLSVHANKPRSISHITLYQCHSVESTLIQGCLNIVYPLGMFAIKIYCAYGEKTNPVESIICLSEVEMTTFSQELLSLRVPAPAAKGSKNWCNDVICLCSCRKTLTFVFAS